MRSIIDWLKEKFPKKELKKVHSTKQHSALIQPVSTKIQNSIYFTDLDEQGNFVLRFAHVTSSENVESICKNGLHLPEGLRQRLLDQLTNIYPNDNPGQLLNAIELNKNGPYAGFTLLVTGRLWEDAHGKPAIFLLPIGSKDYLTSAADNGITDGGEVFKAARMAINKLFGKTVEARYPDAKPVVFVCKLRLEGDGTKFRALNNDEIFIDVSTDAENFFNSENEVRVYQKIPPEYLEFFSMEDYLRCDKQRISPAAKIRIEEILESVGD